jgi:SNF2 family DNA or RNA helicase
LHRAKNPTAKRTKALLRLARVSHRRLGLTGTPVESSPEEWFWVHQFVAPGALGTLDDYRNRYMFPSRWGFEGARNLDDLRRRSKVHHIRFTKAEVLPNLPPLRVRHMPLDPDPAYASVLRRLHKEARDQIVADRKQRTGGAIDDDELRAAAEMTAVSMLRDVCISPRLLHMSDSDAAVALCASGAVPDVDGPKLEALRRICTELAADDERVVIFTYSDRMAQLISERLDEDGVENVMFTGATSNTQRDIARRRFNDPDDTVRAFIATDAGAEGLNLGRCCSTLVNVDVPWTPTRLEQRSNRIHRADGTHDSYLVINLTVRGTLEDGLLRMLEAKADIADALFNERDSQARTTGRRASHSSGRELFAAALEAAAGPPSKSKPKRASSKETPPADAGGTETAPSGRRRSGPQPRPDGPVGAAAPADPVQLGLDLGDPTAA